MQKRILKFSAIVVLAIFISGLAGCAAHVGFQPTTGATVNQANFEIIDSVRGEAEHTKILGFGTAGNMVERARLKALKDAGILTNHSKTTSNKAIINWTSDYEYTFYGLAVKKRIVLSGDVIRYTE